MSDRPLTEAYPLARSKSANVEPTTPFQGDLFERLQIARQLTEWISRLPEGGVIAIDANWGDGKSWFGRHWQAQLVADKFRTIYIDAFESDFVDDPFLLLAAEFKELAAAANPAVAKSIGDKAVAVGKVLAPALAKGLARGALRAVLGESGVDAIEHAVDAASDSAADRLEKALEHRLGDLMNRKETVAAFRETLSELAGSGTCPIVVFIDELDRCNPNFAVRLLERTKHFFSVPGVVFVLLLNRAQLEAAIRGVYGHEIDANLYLHKFLNLVVKLPKRTDLQDASRSFAFRYCQQLGGDLGYSGQAFGEFASSLAMFAQQLGMSYRDIAQAFAYYGISGRRDIASQPFIAYLIALRVCRPETFASIARGASADHEEAATLLKQLLNQNQDGWLLRVLVTLHEHAASGKQPGSEQGRQDLVEFQRQMSRINLGGPKEVFRFWTRLLDLRVD